MSTEQSVEHREPEDDRIVRYLEWRTERRRQRRRRIARIALGAGLSGALAVLLALSVALLRDSGTRDRAGSAVLPPTPDVTPASPARPGAAPAVRPESPVVSSTRSPVVSSTRSPETGDRPPRQAAVEKVREHPSPVPPSTGGATIDALEPTPRHGEQPSDNAPTSALSVREHATPPTSPDKPAGHEAATAQGEPPRSAPPPVAADAPRSAPPVNAPPRVAATPPAPLPVKPAAPVPATEGPDSGGRRLSSTLVERLKQAATLTPAEERRFEQIKTVLKHTPEAWLARQVAQWVESLPPVELDRQRIVDTDRSRPPQSP